MSKEDLLRKIRALTEQGVGGERETAKEIMNRLMEKYGITELDIEAENTELHWFSYEKDAHRNLLAQVIFMVTADGSTFSRLDALGRRIPSCRKIGAHCTKAQMIEIEYAFGFYRDAYDEELESFYIAFINRHNLFPPANACGGDSGLSHEQLTKIEMMMRTMDRRQLRKALPETEEVAR